MRRLQALASALPLLLLVPGAAATDPPAPTLVGSNEPAWTDLTWSPPAGATVSGWLLKRDSAEYDELDETFPPFGPSASGYRDFVTPAPGDTFTYTVRYYNATGVQSLPSNQHARENRPLCWIVTTDGHIDESCFYNTVCTRLPVCL